MGCDDGVAVVDGRSGENTFLRFVGIDLPVELLRTAGILLLRPLVEVAETDVVAEAADEVEGELVETGDEGAVGTNF